MTPKRQQAPERQLTVIAGSAGWTEATWRPARGDEVVAYVRFAFEPNFTVRAVELRLFEKWLHLHRQFPLTRVENAVNADPYLRQELREQIDSVMKKDDLPDFFRKKRAIAKGMSPRIKLERPAGRRLDDDFYAQVAAAYRDAVAFGLNPRKTLAEDSGAPADTVARWIRKARRDEHLPPAAPGKVSA